MSTLEFDEQFSEAELDPARWLPYYLPHWSGRDAAAARYRIVEGILELRIDADTPVWHPAAVPGMRVSNLQTAHRAGALGSTDGQHRTNPLLFVEEVVPDVRLYTPRFGRIEARVRAIADPDCMVALWLIGVEDSPEQSAEICVFEIFGTDVRPGSAQIGVGVKPHGDPRVSLEFEQVRVDIDVTQWHDYAVEWTRTDIRFFVDDRLVKSVRQCIDYPMQLMLNLYEFGATGRPDDADYPKLFRVDHIRGYAHEPSPPNAAIRQINPIDAQ